MKSIIIDTNVLVATLRSRNGASFKLLSLIGTGAFETVVSVPLVIEYEYASVKAATEVGLDLPVVTNILDYICKVSRHQKIFYLWRPALRDPGDDMVLEVGVAASVNTIVTFNKRDFEKASDFGIEIAAPLEFLKTEGLL